MNSRLGIIAAVVGSWLAASAEALQDQPGPRRAEVTVGIEEGDLRGADNRVLQAAVDHVAGMGGGSVRVGPGTFVMRNALRLRDRVRIIGVPGKTILAACDGAKSLLACDGDCYERQITLVDPTGFKVGDGVSVSDKNAGGGFGVTTATLTAQVDERTFKISGPLYLDYVIAQKATAALAFPIVGGWNVKEVHLEGLTIEGNREKRERLDGCRGGGIYFFECASMTVRNCAVRNYNGDGISFQVCDDVVVENCQVEFNTGLGLHPGSGSQRPVVRGNRSTGNGGDGLYVCWRVKHGLFEKNEFLDNRGVGISIGHKDTDNLFRENTIQGNTKSGILFRNESEPQGAHRNVFEKNLILDNGKGTQACIVISGHHDGVVFRDNTIGNSAAGGPARLGISLSKQAREFVEASNRFQHLETPLEKEN